MRLLPLDFKDCLCYNILNLGETKFIFYLIREFGMQQTLLTLFIGLGVIALIGILFWPETGLISRWRKLRQMTERVRQEDALKHIQKQELSGNTANMQSVAGSLGLDTNRAAALIAELTESGLVEHANGGLRLTPEGGQVAMNVIRAHRLWEQYLAERTGFSRSEWHQQAERYEHAFSIDELDELAGTLGNPIYDPHGDPIPSREGELFDHNAVALTNLESGQVAQIVHVGDEPEMVAAQIEAEGLLPGMVVRVSEVTPNRVRFWCNGEEHLLAPMVAGSISVQLLEEHPEEVALQTGTYLNDLTLGQKGRVLSLLPKLRGAERRRLMDLGILPGTVVAADLSSPMGDLMAYRVRDALIALRNDQAQNIQIELLMDEV
jgi:DtxR family Mn-dependent transcriptional regulator